MNGSCPAHGLLGCRRLQPYGAIRCSFSQSKPKGGLLIEGTIRTPQLVYQAPDGEIVVVPNTHYNQPPSWR